MTVIVIGLVMLTGFLAWLLRRSERTLAATVVERDAARADALRAYAEGFGAGFEVGERAGRGLAALATDVAAAVDPALVSAVDRG